MLLHELIRRQAGNHETEALADRQRIIKIKTRQHFVGFIIAGARGRREDPVLTVHADINAIVHLSPFPLKGILGNKVNITAEGISRRIRRRHFGYFRAGGIIDRDLLKFKNAIARPRRGTREPHAIPVDVSKIGRKTTHRNGANVRGHVIDGDTGQIFEKFPRVTFVDIAESIR